ncbi:hypothetical protein MASR2M117_13880 [Paludibacter sp.]
MNFIKKTFPLAYLIFLTAISSFAQNSILIDNFENGNKGWQPINDGWVDFEIVNNPKQNSLNSSAKVMKVTRHAGTADWAGIILRDQVNLTLGSLPGQYRFASVKFLKETSGNVTFKFEKNGDKGSFSSTKDYPNSANEWKEIIFDLAGAAGATYDDYFIMPDQISNLQQDIVVYIDDIVLKTDPNATVGNNEIELPGTYQLVWADEFNGNTYDKSIWKPQISGGGFGNNEKQYYTGTDKNIFTRDGNLVLKAYKETYQNHAYTSGKIWSQSLKYFKYGRVEARFKLPQGRGTWPAIWMMPQSSVYGGWPKSGELDIMEFVGYDPSKIHGTVHREAGYGGNGNGNSINIQGKINDYHIIRIDWEPGYIKWYLNDVLFHTYNNAFSGYVQWPFDQNFYVILNFAVGGDWGGAMGIDDSIWPQEFLIDYVRVYQKREESAGVVQNNESIFKVMKLSNDAIKVLSTSHLPYNMYLYSITGKNYMIQNDLQKNYLINISNLPNGVYLITLMNGEQTYSEKIIK